MADITLYTYPTSPYGQKVGCYLKYKEVDYVFTPVNPVIPKQIKFTKQRQVPVLKVGKEWRKESSELGIWLDELYPEKPLLGKTEEDKNRILEIDRWISDVLIPGYLFRSAVEWQSTVGAIKNGWNLARAVNNATRIPIILRILWPFLVKRAGFVRHMVSQLDLNEPQQEARQRMIKEFEQHLGKGPFLGEQENVSLADLSAFPGVAGAYMMGMNRVSPSFLDSPVIVDWCRRVKAELPSNPLLVPDELIQNFEI